MPVDTRLTYDDFCLLPNDGKRYEIIEGKLFVTPATMSAHQRVVTRLTAALATFVDTQRLGEAFVSPFEVVLSFYDVVEPDIVFISKGRASRLTPKNLQGAPDLVIEVLSESTSRTDRTTKLKLYARYGVDEYWIIDPEEPRAEIYRRQKQGLELVAEVNREGLLTSPRLPGFSIPLAPLVEIRI
jgi:Uma2 family endonuclease